MVDSVKEQEFISRFMEIIDQNLTHDDFEVDLVCRKPGLSRTALMILFIKYLPNIF